MDKPILVTCYRNPDIDGFACAIGYSELLHSQGRNAVPGIFGAVHDEAKFIMDRFLFEYPRPVELKDFESYILVDASTTEGIHPDIDAQKVIEVIDHRKINDASKFPHATIHIELIGSAATLIVEKFRQANVEPSKLTRHLLYAAIVSNTLNFKAAVSTDRDRTAADWLAKKIEGPRELAKEMFIAKSDVAGHKLAMRMAGECAAFTFDHAKIGIVQLEVLEARALAEDRKTDISGELVVLKNQHGLDGIFATILGLDEDTNIFITAEPETQSLLSAVFGVRFTGTVAARPGLIMRKEIVPLLKNFLETHEF